MRGSKSGEKGVDRGSKKSNTAKILDHTPQKRIVNFYGADSENPTFSQHWRELGVSACCNTSSLLIFPPPMRPKGCFWSLPSKASS